MAGLDILTTQARGDRVEIRRFQSTDFDVYIDLLLLTSQNEYSAVGRREISNMLLMMDKDWIWVADEERGAVGFVTARPEKGGLHLIWMDVHPKFQRQGIGTMLLSKVVGAGKSYGLGPLTCEVWDGNEKGLGFYEKHGFRKRLWMENYFNNGLSAWQMVKDI